jgi:L-iditol 2-dehydrogenase
MKAAVLTGIGEMETRDVPEPKLERAEDVLLRIEAVGVCGSDVHYYNEGHVGTMQVEYPWTIGHECGGTVVEAGCGAGGLAAGRRVAVDPLITCNRCDQCLGGRANTCRHQRFLGNPHETPGAMAEYLVMPARCCHPIPDHVTMTAAALCEPLSIGLYAQRMAGEAAGGSAAILGSGPIGLSVLLALRAAGCRAVYVTDLIDDRLALAEQLGADWTGNPTRQDVVAEILRGEPRGVDCAFECAGEQETIDQAVRLLKPGGVLYAIGIPEGTRLSFDYDWARKQELGLQCVRRQNGTVPVAIRMVADGAIDVAPLATHHFPLADAQAAMELVRDYRDGVIKAVIHMGQ